MLRHSLQLLTPYGPLNCVVTVSPTGEVTDIDYPSENLPDTVWQLTYGDKWPRVRARHATYLQLLPYRLEVWLHARRVPDYLKEIRAAFTAERSGERRAFVDWWRKHPDFLPLLNFANDEIDGNCKKILRQGRREDYRGYDEVLTDHLIAMEPLVRDVRSDNYYALIGRIGGTGGQRFLLDQLRGRGLHGSMDGLLEGLRAGPQGKGVQEVLERKFNLKSLATFNHLDSYLSLLSEYRGDRVVEIAQSVLEAPLVDGLAELSTAAGILNDNLGPAPTATRLRNVFAQSESFIHSDRILHLHNRYAADDRKLTLRQVNEKTSAPALTALPQINWPQLLTTYWRQLLLTTPVGEALEVVREMIFSAIPLQQRQGLLQLSVLQEDARITYDPELQLRLARLVGQTRYDKVSTVALRLIYEYPGTFRESEAMLETILPLGGRSGYRTMFGRAVRKLADTPALRRRVRAYYATQEETEKLLRYAGLRDQPVNEEE